MQDYKVNSDLIDFCARPAIMLDGQLVWINNNIVAE
jgi:hypothetical protein